MPGDAPALSLDDVLAMGRPTVAPAPAPAPPAPPSPPPEPAPRLQVEDVLALDQDQDRLKAATSVGLEQQPARAARLIDLQARTGLPTALIDQNLEKVEAAARQRDFDPDAFRRDSPVVASWLAQDPARVGLTRDDLPRLAATEALIRASPDYRYGPDGSIHELLPGAGGYATVYRSPAELRDALVKRGLLADEATAEAERASERLRDSLGPLANVAAGAAVHAGRFATAIGATGSDPAAYRAGLEGTEAASVGLSPGLWGDVQRGAGGLLADLPLLLAGGPVAKAAQGVGTALAVGKTLAPLIGETGVALGEKAALGAATMQPLAVRDALNDYQEHGAGHALTSWAIDSAIAGAFGPVGAGRFAARAAGVALPPMAAETSAAMLILRHAGLAAGQNEAFDLAHRIHDVASGVDPSALDWHNVLHGLALSGILGGVPGAVFAAPEAVEHARQIHDLAGMQRVNAMTAAVHGAETLRAIGDQVNETGAAALNQDAVQGLVQTLARDSRYRTLYVDAQAWRDHFDGKDKPTGSTLTAANDAARAATGDPAAYDKALSSNGQIAIPLEKFVPLLADTAHRDWLTAEARLAPEAMNEREAKEHADAAAERAAIQAADAGPGSRAADLAASADLVHEDIKRQQMAAGVSETVAERNAQIWRAAMHTASERGWTDQLPHEAYAQFKVRIARALENAPTRDALDAMIERLKAGDIPTEADVERAKAKMEGDTERQPTEDSARLEATRHGLLSLLEHFRAVGADLNEPTADLKAKAIAAAQDRGEAFTQGTGDEPRGSFLPQRLSANNESLIRLFKGADRSTFLHESGHALLEFMHDLAGRDSAPESVKADLGQIREWLGAKDGEAITRDQHEQFARGFEKYLMEGKAPSTGLRGAFERFKRWLVEIYKSATALHVHLSDEVRAVFDRILASDEEIAQARAEGAGDQPLFADQAESGMNDQQWKVYLDRAQEGKDRARELLEREIMAPLRAEETKAYQEQRAKTKLAVADQVNQSPAYTALLVLQRGAWPEGVEIPEGAERVKLDKADLVARYGDAALKMLPGPQVEGEAPKPNRGRRLYTDEGGIGLDEAAELFGFKDGGELWHTLVNAPDRLAEIERQTDEAMRAHHPDPLLDGTLHEKARVAIANDPRMEVMEREASALALRAGRSATPSDLLKAIARAQIEKTLAKDLRPSLYRVAMNRAERAAAASVAKARAATDPVEKAKATAEALDHRQNALLQTHLYREASKEAERVEKRRDYVAGWDKLDKREKIGKAGGWEWAVTYRDKAGQQQSEGFSSKDHGDDPAKANAAAIARARMIPGSDVVRTGYLEQADAIREAYDLKRVSNAQLQKREALRDFIARKEADDEPVNIPSEVVADLGKKNWKDLTIAQQQAVVDALKNLEHLANIKNRFLVADRKESFNESRDAQIATIEANSRGVKPEKAVGRGALDTPVDAVGRYFSAMATVSRLAREMDGYKDGGVMFETWLRQVNEANDRELGMRERSTEEMARLVKQWGKLTALGSAKLSYRAFDPEIGKSISHWGRIMVALNWGNADNRQRLMQSEGWSEGQVQRLMGGLDKADMRFVQGILDHIDSWWGDIKAKQERVYGVAPEKVEAVPIIHETGIYRGGYFPIAYDPRSMPKGRDIDVEQQAGLTRAGARLYASTKRGHAETRTGMAEGARVLLDPGVITRHLDNVTHDLAYHETLIDLNRLLRDKDLRQAMVTHWGVDAFRQFQSRLTDIAAGVQGTNTGMERMLEWARQGVNFANRAFNIGQALQQAAGISQSLVRVGPKYFAAALGKMFRAPLGTDNVFRWVDEQSTMMRNRSKTFDKNVADNLVGVGLRGPIRKVLDGAGYYFWTKAFQVLDTHTWLASYMKAMDEHGGDEGKARAIADQTVTDIQGSGATKDLPAIMRGGPLAQVFTSNMSWWLANYNLTAEAINRARSGKPADILKSGADLFVLYGVQVAAWSALSAAISGTNRETWANVMDDPGALAKSLAKDAAYTGLSSMVLFRDLADAAVEGRQFRGPQGLKSMSILASAIGAIRADNEDGAEAKAVAKAAGVVFHLPVASIVNLAEGVAQAQQQGTNPLWPALFGPTRK